jgi:hypothetical protein
MPISPQQLIEFTQHDITAELAEFEKRIDDYLKAEAKRQGRKPIYFHLNTASIHVIQALLMRYRHVGWRVEHSEDRDGKYLRFIWPTYRTNENGQYKMTAENY